MPWIKALSWAFKPTEVIDVRYFPGQEQRNIDEEIAKLKGKSLAKPTPKAENPGLRRMSQRAREGSDTMAVP